MVQESRRHANHEVNTVESGLSSLNSLRAKQAAAVKMKEPRRESPLCDASAAGTRYRVSAGCSPIDSDGHGSIAG